MTSSPCNGPAATDATRLQQVFWNLIQNAIKFSPAGDSAITIRSRNAHGRIRVSVADKGRGIEPELLPRIFEPFEQGEYDSPDGLKGLGLGLAISKRIVEAHNGTLTAASAGRGRGAVFTVEFDTVPEPA